MPNEDFILRPNQLAARLGVCRSTVYEWSRRPDFPRRLKLGPRASGWRWSEIKAWLDQRTAEESCDAPR